MITQRLRTAKTHVAFAVMILSGCDGTDHVAEEGASEPELWSADVVVEIGDVEGDERYLFQRIRSGAVIDGGLSIVLADQLGQIRQYSSRTGEWERTLATKGRGPGEVLYVTKLATRGDSLFAWDVGQNRITTFVGGRAVANQNVTAVVGVSSSNSFEVLPNHFAIQIERGQLRSPDPARGWILAVTRTGDQVDTLLGPYPVPEKGWEIIDEETQRGAMVNPPAMSVYPQWTSVGDGIAWAASDGDSLLYVSTDGEREVIRFNARQPPASVSETDKDRYFSAYASAYDLSSDDMPAIKSSTPVVTRRPTIASLLHDASANEFWIAGFDPTNILHGHVGNTWTVRPVNDSTASPTERWIVPDGVSLIAIRGRVGVGVRTSQLGVDRAVVLSFDPAR